MMISSAVPTRFNNTTPSMPVFSGKRTKKRQAPKPQAEVKPTNSDATANTHQAVTVQPARQPNFFRETLYWGVQLLLGVLVYKAAQPASFNPPHIGLTASSHWGPNTNVMAGGSQRHILTGPTGYSSALSSKLDTARSLGEAQSDLHQNGYINGFRKRQFALSSDDLPSVITINPSGNPETQLSQCLNAWNKDGKPDKKFAILLGGPRRQRSFSPLDKMHESLKRNFLLPGSHIQVEKDVTSQAVTDSIQQFSNTVKKHHIKDAELLLYFNGHGTYFNFPWVMDLSKSEGEATGYIALRSENPLRKPFQYLPEDLTGGLEYQPFSENSLKALLKQLPPDVKTTVIVDTCHAGSWVA